MSTVCSIAAGFSGNPFPGVAQIGSALEWGSRGRWFDSSHSDQEGVTKLLSPRFFQYSCGFMGFLGPTFQNRSTVDVQPPKEQKQQKTAFLLLLRKAVFSFFRHWQRNDFRLSVRAVLGFDRGRRRWGLTGSLDGRNE